MKAQSQFGFALLEVLISVAIVGGLLITVIYTLNYHLGVAERNEVKTIASMLAWDKMLEIEKEPKNTTGYFPEPHTDYQYLTAVKGTPYAGVSEVSVTVKKEKEETILKELIRIKKND